MLRRKNLLGSLRVSDFSTAAHCDRLLGHLMMVYVAETNRRRWFQFARPVFDNDGDIISFSTHWNSGESVKLKSFTELNYAKLAIGLPCYKEKMDETR
ncbi:hypothetical protein KFK09_016417 [Dendrobium nobile]|uniref:Uncharacterized protein n=1 Tax=Dendrobium nobile TaxID=94219 RepID=A0A8T3B0M2_DENNO|nr:hypothetical protein KFK09_016417 [Dendrobium nobile]